MTWTQREREQVGTALADMLRGKGRNPALTDVKAFADALSEHELSFDIALGLIKWAVKQPGFVTVGQMLDAVGLSGPSKDQRADALADEALVLLRATAARLSRNTGADFADKKINAAARVVFGNWETVCDKLAEDPAGFLWHQFRRVFIRFCEISPTPEQCEALRGVRQSRFTLVDGVTQEKQFYPVERDIGGAAPTVVEIPASSGVGLLQTTSKPTLNDRSGGYSQKRTTPGETTKELRARVMAERLRLAREEPMFTEASFPNLFPKE